MRRKPIEIETVARWSMITLLCCTGAAMAGPSGNEPIYLDSDTAELDSTTGISVYTGDVIMTQGVRRVTGDRMTVYTTEQREVRRVVVEGRPAVWIERPADQGELLKGEAPRMEYFTRDPERVMLFEGGTVTQGRSMVSGETLEYNLETEVATAQGKEDRSERTRIVLFPEDGNDDE